MGVNRVVVVGGGPGGYEAALVAAQLGADVTVVDTDGIGGSAVLTDCVPSKTLVATAEVMADMTEAGELGVRFPGTEGAPAVDLPRVNERVKELALAQSSDIEKRLTREGVRVLRARGRLDPSPGSAQVQRVITTTDDGSEETLDADAVLIATGAAPRTLDTAEPDGERILTWEQVYDLDEVPSHLVVVGSGVTGAEFASAYNALGVDVTLVSSRDRVLPGEDADAAEVLEEVLTRRGMTVLSKSRMESVSRDGDAVVVTLTDGRTVEGSHCLLALGSVPNTSDLGLEEAGVVADGRRASSTSTGCRGRRRVGCTPRATAPACSCSPPSRPCRAGSRCGTSWATRSHRSTCAPCRRTCSPPPRSRPSAGRRRRWTPATSTRSASRCRSRATRARRCRACATAS